MQMSDSRFDAVFEGGGVKGIGLVGALSVLEERGYQPTNVAGTSAGAIVASMVAAGYSAVEVKQILTDLEFTNLIDAPPPGKIPLIGPAIDELTQLGLYKGAFFEAFLREHLEARGVRTFRDLVIPEFADDERYRFRLNVVAADISRGQLLVLPQGIAAYGMAPDDLDVAHAVRMSMSIPLFFMPVQLKNADGSVSYIVDGGLLSDFPVQLFDSDGPPAWPTFGFKLVQSGPPQLVKNHIGGPISEILAMFFTAMSAHDAYYLAADKYVRTIGIDTLGVEATDFQVSPERKEALYQSGVKAATDFLQQWDQAGGFEAYKKLYRSGAPIPSHHEMVMPAS